MSGRWLITRTTRPLSRRRRRLPTLNNDGIQVRQATIDDLDRVVHLFDAYRRFYRYASDLDGARKFLLQRFEHGQSVVFLSFDPEGAAVGFTQLYPSFSSGLMARTFILNDLFVEPSARGKGAGAALLNKAAQYARSTGAAKLTLETEKTNTTAQRLYEALGWKRDEKFYSYQLTL